MYPQGKLVRKLKNALKKFYEKDAFLIEQDVNERSISHKLAVYLQEEFNKKDDKWNVDCEYNREGKRKIDEEFVSKRLNLPVDYSLPSNDTKARTVFPDIIVHHRGSEGENNNLLIIEMKKSKTKDQEDFYKLDQYGKELGYQYGLYLNMESVCVLGYWWKDGKRDFADKERPIDLYNVINYSVVTL